MKIKDKIEQTEFYVEDVSFDNQVLFEDNDLPTKKNKHCKKIVLATVVMFLSMSLISNGVSTCSDTTEIHNAVLIKDSKWSQFDDVYIKDYFNFLSEGDRYQLLETVCSRDSKVYTAIQNSLSSMQHLCDEYDGLTRGIQKFGSFISLNSVNGVCNNKVSVSISYVSGTDLAEFFNAYSNDLCRYFTVHELSTENLIRELFNLLNCYDITKSEITIELPVELNDDNKYLISDDTEIINIIKGSYNISISEMIKQIKIHR